MSVSVAEVRARFSALNPQQIVLGLDRIRLALEHLHNPERQLRNVIHIAGTNGKGSAVAVLEAAAIASGTSIQSYTSPFLWNFTENIRLNGTSVEERDCANLFEHVWTTCRDIPLTLFEADTLVALLQFSKWDADLTVIECGMGGASDATAVVPTPVAAILTNVDQDHAEFLGSDLQQVALEKAGISKTAPLYVPEDFTFDVGPVQRVNVGEMHPSLALANAVLRNHFDWIKPLHEMPFNLGRWTRDSNDSSIIYDVGHNAHAARFLANRLINEPGPYCLRLGMLKRKDPKAFLEAFRGLDLYVDPVDLGKNSHSRDHICDVARALGFILFSAQNVNTTLVTGSHQNIALNRTLCKQLT